MAVKRGMDGLTSKQRQTMVRQERNYIKKINAIEKKAMAEDAAMMKQSQIDQENMQKYGTIRPTAAHKKAYNDRMAELRAAERRQMQTGSSLLKKSLTSIIKESAHLPAVLAPTPSKPKGEMIPLYLRPVGSNVESASLDAAIAAYCRKNHTQKTPYNSPRNVRVVCIGRNGVHVGCWVSPISAKGTPEKSTYLYQAYPDNFRLEAGRFNFENAGLGFIKSPEMVNLEEIWITADAFSGVVYQGLYQRLRNAAPGTVSSDAGVTQEIISVLNREIGTDFRTRFPLLRCVVIANVVPLPDGRNPDFSPVTKRLQEFTQGKTVNTVLSDLFPRQRVSLAEVPQTMEVLSKKIPNVGYVVCPIPGANILAFESTGRMASVYRFDERLKVVRQKLLEEYGVLSNSTTTSNDEPENRELFQKAQDIMDAAMKVLSAGGFSVHTPLSVLGDSDESSTYGFKILSPDNDEVLISYNPLAWKGSVLCLSEDSSDNRRKLKVSGSNESEQSPSAYGRKLAAAANAIVGSKDAVERDDVSNPQEESLYDIIVAMESEGTDTSAVGKALWAMKRHNKDYFDRQVGKLPADVRRKYSSILEKEGK